MAILLVLPGQQFCGDEGSNGHKWGFGFQDSYSVIGTAGWAQQDQEAAMHNAVKVCLSPAVPESRGPGKLLNLRKEEG